MDRTKLWELSQKIGGVFKLTVLLQKRIRELVNGAPRLVDMDSDDYIQIAIREVEEDLISLDHLSHEELQAAEEQEREEAPPRRPEDILLGNLPPLDTGR